MIPHTHFGRVCLFVFSILIMTLPLPSCEHRRRVVIESGSPPQFRISGPGSLDHFEITGPDLDRDASNRRGNRDYLPAMKVYWRLAPTPDTKQALEGIGTIRYGQIPRGLIQVYPEQGPPPPLVEGDLYNVHLEPDNSDSFNTFFSIREGKIVAVGQK